MCEHRNVYYFRSECGGCGDQEATCQDCHQPMCGCAERDGAYRRSRDAE